MTRFPAKLLLFGEYAILLGSSALSVPFHKFGACLGLMGGETGEALEIASRSTSELKRLYHYLRDNSQTFVDLLDLNRFITDLDNGLYLESTIPQQYGMGSSGALCAAVYHRYQLKPVVKNASASVRDISALRSVFISMESFFHGKSSGFDPLVSFLGTALLLQKDGEISFPDMLPHHKPAPNSGIFLVDSGEPCRTGPLVGQFLDEYAPGGIVTQKGIRYSTMVNSAIESLIGGNNEAFRLEINRLSGFQLANMGHFVPAALRPVWADGLETGLFSMKLCGSGGGGFLLCFSPVKDEAIGYFNNLKISWIDTNL